MESSSRRRSSRISVPVLKQEQQQVKMAEETRKMKSRGKRKIDETNSTSEDGDHTVGDEEIKPVHKKKKRQAASTRAKKKDEEEKRVAEETDDCKLIGDEIPSQEAKERWPERFKSEGVLVVKAHYSAAEVDGITYRLNENAFVKSDKKFHYICKIVEFFRTNEGQVYFTAQWFYRASDTVIQNGRMQSDLIDKKRIFFSDIKDDNPLECLVGKPTISMISDNVEIEKKKAIIANAEYYCDMRYELPYNTFIGIPPPPAQKTSEAKDVSSGLSSGSDSATGGTKTGGKNPCTSGQSSKSQLTLLDLYAGCGAMSTGLCLGAKIGGVNLTTRWALDLNESACQSLSLNHPEAKVTTDCGENYLSLLREWERLCQKHNLVETSNQYPEDEDDSEDIEECEKVPGAEYEVEKIVGISYGNPENLENVKKSKGKGAGKKIEIPKGSQLYFKVHWKGYESSEDTWEPYSSLSNCKEKIGEYVTEGYHSKLLPLPGDVDVICGGPPCQGISGFNMFRNKENPLADEKNLQMVVYMQIVEFLKPQYVLMENVVDLLKFSEGFLARHAVSRLISLDYQVRVGIIAAGSFGLPQFRQRVFVWGTKLGKKLPPYPLPTHEAVVRGGLPNQFDRCLVAHDEIKKHNVKAPLLLEHALSDLPKVENNEDRDEIPYGSEPRNDFQRYIRRSKTGRGRSTMLYNHVPLKLNTDDYQRVCKIPKKKNAFFYDLGGVTTDSEGKWKIDPKKRRVYLKSGKPLIPNYALTYVNGKSKKPFGRLWWDETVPTVVTRAEPHNQVILHPEQDRVLSVRENARLQGFPDSYRLCGDVRDKYTQVGNAVAVPVSKALGYALALAFRGLCNEDPVIKLPANFAYATEPLPLPVEEHDEETSDMVQ